MFKEIAKSNDCKPEDSEIIHQETLSSDIVPMLR